MNQSLNIFDGHAHLAPGDIARDKLLTVMEQEGIRYSIVVAGGIISPDMVSLHTIEGGGVNQDVNNEAVLDSCLKSNGRLLPFFFANPYKGHEEYSCNGHKYYGLKLAPAVHGVKFNDNRTHELIKVAIKLDHPIYTHCINHPGLNVKCLVQLAEYFAEAKFILGHAGTINLDLNALNAIKNNENISFETSGGFTYVIQEAINRLGSERVIFGSEYPLEHPKPEIEKYRTLNLNEDVWRKVTFSNIYNLVGKKRIV